MKRICSTASFELSEALRCAVLSVEHDSEVYTSKEHRTI